MSYAQRPMGDYKTYGYAGDPGWLSSIWRGIKKVAPAIIGTIIGGPVGGAIGAGLGGGRTPPIMAAPPGTMGAAITFPGGTRISGALPVPTRGPRGFPKLPATIARNQAAANLAVAAQTGVVPSGYHYAKDGSGKIVRNRRMNIANPRALRRSMRRVQGFEKLAKRTIQFTRRVKMKKRRSS